MASRQVVKSILWACMSSWYYGYHLTELNYPVAGLTCFPSSDHSGYRLPPCIGLDQTKYGLVTSLLTAGGLAGSLFSDRLVRAEGVAGAITWTGWLNLAAAILMAAAPHWLVMALGRVVAGVASGLAICLVPPYLAAISRTTPELSAKSGLIGTLNQLGIVLGICSAQVAGMLLTGPKGNKTGAWRWVCALTAVVSIIQIVTAEEDGPAPRHEPHRADEENPEDREANGPLSPSIAEAAAPLLRPKLDDQLTIRGLLSNRALRRPALLVTVIMCLQQWSGVNAVLFYSTSILATIFPNAGAGVLSVGITVVNALMTFPAILLVDRIGRRSLLLTSTVSMGLMALLLAYGLDSHAANLSGLAIVCFIAAFSIGLGPVPFLLVSEMVPVQAVPALSSLALSASWISTFLIGSLFLPLRDFLAYPVDPRDPESPIEGNGRVFYVFAGMLALATFVTLRGVPK